MFVIVAGNVIDGVALIGPFDDGEEANFYGDMHVQAEWVVATLEAPVVEPGTDAEVAQPESTRTLRIVRTDAHDDKAVYIDDQLVFAHDFEIEALYRVAKHLGWDIQTQTISGEDYEREYN